MKIKEAVDRWSATIVLPLFLLLKIDTGSDVGTLSELAYNVMRKRHGPHGSPSTHYCQLGLVTGAHSKHSAFNIVALRPREQVCVCVYV